MITVATESEMLAEQQARQDILAQNNAPVLDEKDVCDRDWNVVNHPNCWDFDRFSKTMRNA